MEHAIERSGVIVQDPVVEETYTSFAVRIAGDEYKILRYDPGWQVRDVLFLRVGQRVEIRGKPSASHMILAEKIMILDIERKESNDTEAI